MITIVMPTYNQAQFIAETLRSIFWQTYKDWELIIVNDGCDDETEKIIMSFKNEDQWKKVRYTQINHAGYTKATNHGLNLGSGQYETMISSDNIYFKDFLSDLVSILDEKQNVGFAYSDFQYIDEGGNLGKAWLRPPWTKNLFLAGYHAGICFLWRRKLREKIDGFDETLLASDYDFILKCEEEMDCFHVPKILGYYRDHPETVSNKRHGATDDSMIKNRALKRRGL